MNINEARTIIAKYRPPYSQCQKAMRKAFNVTDHQKKRKRKRHPRKYTPTPQELEECRTQKIGVHLD